MKTAASSGICVSHAGGAFWASFARNPAMSDLADELRANHRENTMLPGVCSECVQYWPCDALRAADRIEKPEAALHGIQTVARHAIRGEGE